MKHCPYCAEEIQDAAIVCKHCGRDLTRAAATSSPTRPAPANRRARLGLTIGLVVVLLIVIGIYVAQQLSAPTAAPQQAAQVPPPPPPRPITVPIADGRPVEIQAQRWQDYAFKLPARACTVRGRVEGISGGGKDFEGLVMDDDNFRNWSASHDARGQSSGRVVVWTPDLTLQGPGTFHLVVSNAFSLMTGKVVTVRASAICP